MDLVNVSWHRYDLGWNVLGDYAAGGGSWGVGTRTNSYQWHGMTPLAETPGANPGTGATRHHLHDHLGSTRALFDGGKARLARLDYAPHGQPTRALGAAANRSFTGKQYDAAIGMYHFPYRHYSPSHARWMTRDPLGMVDGPNVYAYVRGAAVTAVDELGLFCVRVYWKTKSTKLEKTDRPPLFSCFDKRSGWAEWHQERLFRRTTIREHHWYCRDKDECGKTRYHWKTTTETVVRFIWKVTHRVQMRTAPGTIDRLSVNPWTGKPEPCIGKAPR